MALYEYIVYSITTRCNLSCPSCFRVGTGERDLPVDLFERSIPNVKSLGCKCINLSGGEPLLHLHWRSFIKTCAEVNIAPFLSTNGLLLKDLRQPELSALTLLAVPLDGHCAGLNDQMRCAGHFEKVMSLINQYKENSFSFTLKINTVVRPDNFPFLESLFEIFGEDSRIIWKLFQFAPRGKFSGHTAASISSKAILQKVDSFVRRKSTKCSIIYLPADSAGNYLIVDADGDLYVPAETVYNKIGSVMNSHVIDMIVASDDLKGNTLKGRIGG